VVSYSLKDSSKHYLLQIVVVTSHNKTSKSNFAQTCDLRPRDFHVWFGEMFTVSQARVKSDHIKKERLSSFYWADYGRLVSSRASPSWSFWALCPRQYSSGQNLFCIVDNGYPFLSTMVEIVPLKSPRPGAETCSRQVTLCG